MQPPRVVNPQGKQITLTPHQKNEMYRKAKELRDNIKHSLLTKDEHWHPTPANVKKFMEREGSKQMSEKITLFRKHMQAIGADPNDFNIEKMRGK